MYKLSNFKDLQVIVNPTERDYTLDKYTKGFVSKSRISSWKTKENGNNRNLTIIINSPIHYKYQLDVYSKGFVKKNKLYIAKWF